MNEVFRVIIAGGGTGGHLFPGLAVAEVLKQRAPTEIVFFGSSYGIENRVVPKHGYRLVLLPVRALRGQGSLGLLVSSIRLPLSVIGAWRRLGEIRPELVVGVGGYASAPAVLAAWMRRIPTVLLEQNAHPGLTNRLLGKLADRVCITFPESARHFPRARTVETGNPVRPPAGRGEKRNGAFAILIFGGSAGAHRLNEVGVDAVAALRDKGPMPRIVHQTGEADLDWVKSRYRALGIDADVRPFIDDMPSAYTAVDLVVCRAGATTLAEITALGKPAVLIPYPYAADDHQRKNAESLVARGAAVMILDRELTPENLSRAIHRLRDDPESLRAMSASSRALGRPGAAERVVDVCLELVHRRKGS